MKEAAMVTGRSITGAVALLLLIVEATPAEDIIATNFGYYYTDQTETGAYPGIQNYAVGKATTDFDSLTQFRNFFVFDLSSLTADVPSATLRLNALSIAGTTNTLELYDVTTSIDTLTTFGSDKAAIYEDLGSGTVYGARVILELEHDTYIDIELNDDCLAAINANHGKFAIGGTLNPPGPADDQYVFGYGGEVPLDFAKLILPEPGTFVLALLGAVSMFVFTHGHRIYRRP
jgi:hypothetical protein